MNMMVSAAIAGTALVPDLASAASPTPAAPAKTDRRALEAYAAWLHMERRLPRRQHSDGAVTAINIIKQKNAVHLVNGWRVLGWFGPACCNAFSSISQVELHTQALRYFFGAPLKSERITLRKNNCRLPTEGMVASNSDVEMIYPDLAGDHRSELASRFAFFDHRSNPDCPMHHQCIETRKIALKDSLQFSRNWQSIIKRVAA